MPALARAKRRRLLQGGAACALATLAALELGPRQAAQAAAAEAADPASAFAPALPSELLRELPDARTLGAATLRFLGLRIYQARLWVGSGFQASAFAHYPLALELTYFRALSGRLIAERSLQEMRRQGPLDAAREQLWLQAMQQAFPDVQAGERITGLHTPGVGARFWHQGQNRPGLADPAFSSCFFGIWLSPASSEPRLRAELLGQAPP